MSFSFLITIPRHDTTVQYLASWSKEVLGFAKNRNIKYRQLEGPRANRKDVESALRKQNPDFVLFNGHGDETTISGHKNEPLIISNKNEHLLESKIVYALACNAAKQLGRDAVKKGCKAFIGYEAVFGFVRDITREASPVKDKFARPFKEFSNTISISLLKGNTVHVAVERARKRAQELIRYYSTSDAEPGYRDVRFWLFWDSYFLTALGNTEAGLK